MRFWTCPISIPNPVSHNPFPCPLSSAGSMQIFCNCNRGALSMGHEKPLWPQIAHCARHPSGLDISLCVCVCVLLCVWSVLSMCVCVCVFFLVVSAHWNLIQLWKGNFTHSIEYYERPLPLPLALIWMGLSEIEKKNRRHICNLLLFTSIFIAPSLWGISG